MIGCLSQICWLYCPFSSSRHLGACMVILFLSFIFTATQISMSQPCFCSYLAIIFLCLSCLFLTCNNFFSMLFRIAYILFTFLLTPVEHGERSFHLNKFRQNKTRTVTNWCTVAIFF